jgi:hypothetical protein
MKYILLTLLLTGCTTVPVVAKFPEAPSQLLEACPELQKLNDQAKLSDISKTAVLNYTTYYQCTSKTEAWIDWYRTQKKIFEGITK